MMYWATLIYDIIVTSCRISVLMCVFSNNPFFFVVAKLILLYIINYIFRNQSLADCPIQNCRNDSDAEMRSLFIKQCRRAYVTCHNTVAKHLHDSKTLARYL